MPEVPEESSAAGPRILREEAAWLVVDKPAGWHAVAGRGETGPSVEAWLRATRPELAGLDEAGLVHRLDRFTSGCLLVARDAAGRERLRDAFSGRGGDLRKIYLALVAGRAEPGSFTLSFTSRHKGSAKVTVSSAFRSTAGPSIRAASTSAPGGSRSTGSPRKARDRRGPVR